MCIALPARVTSIDGAVATVDRGNGRQMPATTLLLPDVHVGDWVLVATGTIVDRLSADDARHMRDALTEAMEADARDRNGGASTPDW